MRNFIKQVPYFTRKHISKIVFFSIGITSTIWFLIRVIPKPSRATYPCMRTAAPLMSGFIIYLLSMSGSFLLFKKANRLLVQKKRLIAATVLLAAVSTFFISESIYNVETKAADADPDRFVANNPIGTAFGIDPGRVVWVMDKDAVNEKCTNTSGDLWWAEKNNDQDVIKRMLKDGILKLAVEANLKDAWEALFKYHNNQLGRGNKGYTQGEDIYIKLNFTTSAGNGPNMTDRVDTSPYLLMALLDELINEAGVKESDITVGDPFREFKDFVFDLIKAEYPGIKCVDNLGKGGKIQSQMSANNVWFTSDPDNDFETKIPQEYIDAEYFINVPIFKSHIAAGITIAAKNHQGSVLASKGDVTDNLMGKDLHYCFPNSKNGYDGYGKYRHLVDYMGHKYMGGNTMLNLVDGLWAGREASGFIEKFGMPPFNDDYPSSIFLSQDRVAIEAVSFDFLLYEYTNYPAYHGTKNLPLMGGVTDYIEQAASPDNWPDGIEYDPENDGTTLGSMGVYEHWNDPENKQYSKNLGNNYGIHLVTVPAGMVKSELINSVQTPIANNFDLLIYPQPATTNISIAFNLDYSAEVRIELYSLSGQELASHNFGQMSKGENLLKYDISSFASGIYLCKLISHSENGVQTQTQQLHIKK